MPESILAALSCAVLLASSSTWAAEAREGRLLLEGTDAPIADAEVSILGVHEVVRTDAEGKFALPSGKAPPFELLVVLPGGRYLAPILVAELPTGEPLVLRVKPDAEESLTVTGAAPTIDAAPAAGTTSVSRSDLELKQPGNLMQSLEDVAGVSQVSEGHASVPAVRGLARGRTVILVDGARVSSERRVGPSAGYLDPFVLDSLEVARGPGSVAYGSDAFGGVISARTQTFEIGGPLVVQATGTASTGEPGARGGVGISGGLGERMGFAVAGHYRDYDDYDSPEGEVFNSGWRDYGGLVKVGGRVGPGILTVGGQWDYARDVGRPRNNSQTVRFYYPEEDSSRFTLGWEAGQVAGFSRMGVTGFFGSYSQITDQDRFQDDPRTIERADVSADDWQVRAFVERWFGSPVRFEAGVDANGRRDLHALDIAVEYQAGVPVETVNVSVDSAERTDLGAYATVDWQVAQPLSLSLGVRGDSVDTKNEGGFFGDLETSNDAVSGLFAVTAGSFHGFSATAQVSTGFRDPVLSDRYFRGPSGQGFITGNPDLVPEESLQYDLALHQTLSWGRIGLYAYQYEIEDLIERFEETDDNFFFRNRGEARLRGIELEAQVKLPRGFALAFSAQTEKGITLDDEAPIDDIPAQSVRMRARKDWSRGFAILGVAGVERDERPGPNEIVTPGYGLVDLGGGFTIARWLELRAYVRNVLDQPYYASPDSRFVLAPGTTATLTALLKF